MGGHFTSECCVFREYLDTDGTGNMSDDEIVKLLNKDNKFNHKALTGSGQANASNLYSIKQLWNHCRNDLKPKYSPIINDNHASSDSDQRQQAKTDDTKPFPIRTTRHKSIHKPSRRRKPSKSRHTHSKRSRHRSVSFKEELNEAEIKLKEQIHQTQILKQENSALRQANFRLKHSKARSSPKPPTPPIAPYPMYEEYSSPVRPVSPITISITTGSEVLWNDELSPRLSPMVDPIPPSPTLEGVTPSTESALCMIDIEKDVLYEQCQCTESCSSIKRVVQSLEWYALYMNDDELLRNKMDEYKYSEFLYSDYQHIMCYHLKNDSGEHDKIMSVINMDYECNVNTCNGFKRYKSRENILTNSVMDTMDVLHSHFMHLE